MTNKERCFDASLFCGEKMNEQNYKVLTNIIGAVETGGQVYGCQRYEAYTAPGTNTPGELTVTLGGYQAYGSEAKDLIRSIYDADPVYFASVDKKGLVASKLNKDWVAIRWNPSTEEKKILITLISSDLGKRKQDEYIRKRLEKYVARAESYGIKDPKGIMMSAQIQHLGGTGPLDRILKRCNGNYSLGSFMDALKKDQSDTSSSNQVGDKIFWSRHVKCKEMIEKYAVPEDSGAAAEENKKMTIVEFFEKHQGVTEYNGIVATIQKWFYGSLVRDAWCATSTSYAADQAGILDQIGGKNEGVSEMMAACKKLHERDGRFYGYSKIPYQLKRNDIVFFKRNGSSHVAHVWEDCFYTGSGYINVIGGNQSDMICKKDYRQANISAIYRPDYGSAAEKPVEDTKKKDYLSLGDNGSEVKTLQQNLNQVMAAGLDADGDFGKLTDKAVRNFQKKYGLTVDGCYGKLSAAKMTELLNGSKTGLYKYGTVTADKLNVRTGPGKNYGNLPGYPILNKGNEVDVIETVGKWLKVKIAAKYIGYVAAEFIKLH